MRIALIGPMGAGKTTIARALEQRFQLRRESFAAPLREFAELAYGEVDKDAMYEVRHRVAPGFEANARETITGRKLLQRLGTEAIRDSLDQDFWIKALERRLIQGESYVVDDCRFVNEYDALKRLGFTFVRLHGRGVEPTAESHPSERGQLGFRVDFTMRNFGRIPWEVAGDIAIGALALVPNPDPTEDSTDWATLGMTRG